MTSTFDLYIAALRRFAAVNERAAFNYLQSGRREDQSRASDAVARAVEAHKKANRLEAAASV